MRLSPSGQEHAQKVLNVVNSYAWSFDSNDAEKLASIFSDDATTQGLIKGSPGWGPWNGRREIAQRLGDIRKRQVDRRRHQLTTPVFSRLTDTEATVKVYLSLLATPRGGKPRVVTTGHYDADLVKVSGEWKISRLDAELDGQF